MTDDEMRTLLEKIIETQIQYVTLRSKDYPARIQLAEPATDDELDQLSAHLARHGLRIPPSYRRFLRISNGIFRFRWQQSFSLRSTAQIIQAAEQDEGWEDLGEDFEDLEDVDEFGPVHRFIIGTGDITNVCAFDPDTLDEQGEMKVIEFNIEANPPMVHENLEACFRYDLEIYKQDLARELGDRANREED